jgi:hypothetical protein
MKIMKEIKFEDTYPKHFTYEVIKRIKDQLEKDIPFCEIRVLAFGDCGSFINSKGNTVMIPIDKTIEYDFKEPVVMSMVVNRFVEVIEEMIREFDCTYSDSIKPLKIVIEDFRIKDNFVDEIKFGIEII